MGSLSGYPSGVSPMRSRSSIIDAKTATAPDSRSSCSENPPVSTATVWTPARFAALTSHGVSPTITALARAEPVERREHEVGFGLGLLDVGRRGPPVGEVASVEQVEVVVDLLLLGRARQHDA